MQQKQGSFQIGMDVWKVGNSLIYKGEKLILRAIFKCNGFIPGNF